MPDPEKSRSPWILTGILLFIVVAYYAAVVHPIIMELLDRSQMVRSESTIKSHETALTAVLLDAGRRDLNGLLIEDEFARILREEMARSGRDEFTARVAIYSVLTRALLEHGNGANSALASGSETSHLSTVLRPEVLLMLDEKYLDPAEFVDPWGSRYRIFFGPWKADLGISPLRIYDAGDSEDAVTDKLTVKVETSDPAPQHRGYPPPQTKPFYIWSLGLNRQSDQAVFDPTGEYEPPASSHYRPDASPKVYGGGDDINNWDAIRSYQVLYRR